ncbi:phosphotransferase [Marinobacter gelidimuriae]|uniref:phosphotransferase n=1 Tax=Marinobacter gelidimuriae TaxID=2739064 RepID=UPI00035FCF12|nr:phosphotransferase [Marinobacter gelidimuriae]
MTRNLNHGQSGLFHALGVSETGLEKRLADTVWRGQSLRFLPDTGLAHAHVRLGDSGQLLRIPKQSQVGLDPEPHLAHEAICFQAAAPSLVTPALHQVLPVSPALPRGALVLDYVEGVPLALPEHLTPLSLSLARIHRVDVPQASHRRLSLPEDPLVSMIQEIRSQAEFLARAGVSADVQARVQGQLEIATRLVGLDERPPESLITFDAHPGNFLVDKQGAAWMVDLEKCRISYPGFDLAHSTLYTSTTWDMNSYAVLAVDDIAYAYQSWEQAFGARGADHRPWHVPLRRLMWLWSTTWCAKWLALSRDTSGPDRGQNWSESNNEDALNAHVRERANHYLEPAVIDAIVSEFDELERLLA